MPPGTTLTARNSASGSNSRLDSQHRARYSWIQLARAAAAAPSGCATVAAVPHRDHSTACSAAHSALPLTGLHAKNAVLLLLYKAFTNKLPAKTHSPEVIRCSFLSWVLSCHGFAPVFFPVNFDTTQCMVQNTFNLIKRLNHVGRRPRFLRPPWLPSSAASASSGDWKTLPKPRP